LTAEGDQDVFVRPDDGTTIHVDALVDEQRQGVLGSVVVGEASPPRQRSAACAPAHHPANCANFANHAMGPLRGLMAASPTP